MSRHIARAEAAYAKFLCLYPAGYRREYGEDMRATFVELAEEYAAHGQFAVWGLLAASAVDVCVQASKERMNEIRKTTMAPYQPTDPVRGVRSFFIISTVLALILSLVPLPFSDVGVAVLAFVFALGLIPLLVISQKGWGRALFVSFMCFAAGVVLMQVFSRTLLQLPLWLGLELGTAFSEYFMTMYSKLLLVAPFILVGFLAVREVQQPRLLKLWQLLGAEKGIRTVSRYAALLLGFSVVAALLAVKSTLLPMGDIQMMPFIEAYNSIGWMFAVLYSTVPGMLILVGWLALCVVTVSLAWKLSGQRLKLAIPAVALFVAASVGAQVYASFAFSPKVVERQLSQAEGVAIAESCAYDTAKTSGRPIDEVRKDAYLKGSAPIGVNEVLCNETREPHEENGVYYYSGFGSSVDQQTGEAVNYTQQGFQKPAITKYVTHPLAYLVTMLMLAFLAPALIGIATMWVVAKLGAKRK